MELSLRDKTALITGGGGGIGAETASALAEAGARIALVDIDAAAGESTAKKLRAAGAEAIFIQADVTDEESVANYVAETVKKFGAVDVFFNNAGIEGKVAPITDYTVKDFDRVMAINVRGVFLGLKHVLKVMLPRKSGSIINISSVSGLRGTPVAMSAYIASKHAVIGLTRAAAIEAAPAGVRVNAICPGAIETRMIRSIEQMSNPENPAAVAETIKARNPMGRYGTPAEIARVVLFLASDLCPYVNGDAISIDGARTAA